MVRIRKLIYIFLLLFILFSCVSCNKKEIDYSNNHIYTNDFLEEHYYSKNIQYELVLDDGEKLSVNEYCFLQKYIDILCHYIELEKINEDIVDEIKNKPYSYLVSTVENKKVEVYISQSGKVLIVDNNEYYISKDNAIDYNMFSQVKNFKDLIENGSKNIWGFAFNYGYYNQDSWITDLTLCNNKEQYKYYRYTHYFIEYLSNIDLKLIKFSGTYDDGENITGILTFVANEMTQKLSKDDDYCCVKVTTGYIGEYDDVFSLRYSKDMMIVTTKSEALYCVNQDLNELFDSLMKIYNHEIEDLNNQIDLEWDQMQNDN